MSTLARSKITAVEIQQAQSALADLLERCNQGEEIVITQGGRPLGMLISRENVGVLSSVGAIRFELPFGYGGFGWMGPAEDEAANRVADQAYAEQFETR